VSSRRGPHSLAAVILAAGDSTRMGTPKALLPWGKETVISHLLKLWQRLGADEVVVVTRANDDALRQELERIRLPQTQLANPNPGEGMFSSIQYAARRTGWRPGLTHWAIILGDQPHLPAATLSQLLVAAACHPADICQPAYAGRGRHPVILPGSAFSALRSASHQTLKQFLSLGVWPIRLVEINDEALALDLDNPQDYKTILAKFPPESPDEFDNNDQVAN